MTEGNLDGLFSDMNTLGIHSTEFNLIRGFFHDREMECFLKGKINSFRTVNGHPINRVGETRLHITFEFPGNSHLVFNRKEHLIKISTKNKKIFIMSPPDFIDFCEKKILEEFQFPNSGYIWCPFLVMKMMEILQINSSTGEHLNPRSFL